MRRMLMFACVIALATGCSSSGGTSKSSPTTAFHASPTTTSATPVVGKWVNATPAVSVGNTARGFEQRSGTTWSGDLVGTTTYVAYTRSDPAQPGAGLSEISEVFTGSVRGIGRGRLYLSERMSVAAKGGAMRNVATIERGNGALTGVTGSLLFIGTLDVTADGSVAVSGLGHGTYTGTIHH